MKKIFITIITLAALLASCGSGETMTESETSWRAFCDKYAVAYDCEDDSVYNRYLDTWCGSQEEDAAFEAAGINND